GDSALTVVPMAMRDYIVSSNLNICLFRATNGSLCLWRKTPFQSNVVWRTSERYFMDQVAFSPSGNRVAFLHEGGNRIEVADLSTGKQMAKDLQPALAGFASVAWTLSEERFVIGTDVSAESSVIIRESELDLSPI